LQRWSSHDYVSDVAATARAYFEVGAGFSIGCHAIEIALWHPAPPTLHAILSKLSKSVGKCGIGYTFRVKTKVGSDSNDIFDGCC